MAFYRVALSLVIGLATSVSALAGAASPEEVKAALDTFYPGVVGTPPANADLAAAIGDGLEGDWYRADTLAGVSQDQVAATCGRWPIHITSGPDRITIIQTSKPAPVTYRYAYVGGSLYSESVDIAALFARLGVDKIPEGERRRLLELTILKGTGGLVVIVRASANVLWMYSLAGGPRLYARCS